MQQPTECKKLGLLGGTFDPVHCGHLAVARHVQQTLQLDEVWFIPAALPPHKTRHADGQAITEFGHRLAMLQKATAGNSAFVVSDIEAKRRTPSYSIDTIEVLLPQVGEESELFFIVGIDAFLEIDTWKRYKELPSRVNFVIISRPGYAPEKAGEVILQNFSGYAYNSETETWSSPHCKGLFILQRMQPIPISSTEVRRKVSSGQDVSELVPPAVAEYIREQALYLPDDISHPERPGTASNTR